MSTPGYSSNESLNPQLKQHLKELGDAISESVLNSEQVSEVVAKIKASGYNTFLILATSVGLTKCANPVANDETATPGQQAAQTPLRGFELTQQDERFLKSLKISGN